jgi:KaiC/GvpD/RAD55 family RecA-like ATPase
MSNAGSDVYDLSGVLPIESLSSVRPGSSLLVSGPALSGADDVLLDVLVEGLRTGEGAIAITTGDAGTDWVENLDASTGEVPGYRIGAIDCRSESGRSERELDGGAFTYSVPAPSDFTGIGIGVTKCLDRLQDAGIAEARLALTSLSTMLTYADRQTTFKFCHVLSSRLASAGYVGVFTIDSSAHDEQTMQVLKQAFDGQIQLHEDGRRARLRGLEAGTTEWVTR